MCRCCLAPGDRNALPARPLVWVLRPLAISTIYNLSEAFNFVALCLETPSEVGKGENRKIASLFLMAFSLQVLFSSNELWLTVAFPRTARQDEIRQRNFLL